MAIYAPRRPVTPLEGYLRPLWVVSPPTPFLEEPFTPQEGVIPIYAFCEGPFTPQEGWNPLTPFEEGFYAFCLYPSPFTPPGGGEFYALETPFYAP